MNSIGGYFELELHNVDAHYHENACRLKNGRSALHAILAFTKPSLVYVPYYTCDSMLEPFAVAEVPYRFYELNARFEPKELPELNAGEYLLYVNYFGEKGPTVNLLSEKYKSQLIIDATQAFFMKGDGVSWLFNSCRKFFGVPDGAYLYAPLGIVLPEIGAKNEKYITGHLLKRFHGHTQEGYIDFQKNEALMDCSIVGMSAFSEQLLSGVDYYKVADKRRYNYEVLWQEFRGDNLLEPLYSYRDVPMCYPLLLDKKVDKQKLIADGVFIPSFWNEVLDRVPQGFATEKRFAENLLPLPIDHRYTTDDMDNMIISLAKIL